jgi:hypothetical protein
LVEIRIPGEEQDVVKAKVPANRAGEVMVAVVAVVLSQDQAQVVTASAQSVGTKNPTLPVNAVSIGLALNAERE